MMPKNLPTATHHSKYQKVFDYFNMVLFDNKLHSCMLIFSRNNNIIGGYFSPEKWVNDDGDKIHEIAVNANNLQELSYPKLMSIIVHEMCHLEQFLFGNYSRNGYHNKEWCDRAKELGMEVIGSGQQVDTEIKPDGKLELACLNLPDDLVFEWTAYQLDIPGNDDEKKVVESDDKRKKSKSGTRVCYQCAVCGSKVWGKSGLAIMCMGDDRQMVEGE